MKSLHSVNSMSSHRGMYLAIAGLMLLAVAGVVAGKEASMPAAKSTNAPAVEMAIPTSTFNSGPESGRNPFFPQSARDSKTPDAAPVASRFPEGVRIGGISGFPARPMAIVNTVTFAPGETNQITLDGRRVTARVLSIKEHSVVVSINGITKEMPYRKEF